MNRKIISKKKIYFYLPNLKGGGAERVIVNLLNYFKMQGYNFKLLLGQKKGALIEQLDKNIEIVELGKVRSRKALLQFIKFCWKEKPDLIIATLGAAFTSTFAKSVLPKETKVVSRLGNTIGTEVELYNFFLKKILFVYQNYIIGRNSDDLIFQSQYMKRDFISVTGIDADQSFVIYNPVNVKEILSKTEMELDKSYDLVAVGRLDLQKDYITMIRALSILKDSDHSLTLAVLGEGKLRRELEEKIKELNLQDSVFLKGFVSNPYPYMKNSKFLICSSIYEGFSNVIIEALCLGTPVIATDCPGGNSEAIKDDQNGLLSKVSNPEDMANKIDYGLKNYLTFDKKKISKEASKKYDIENISNQYLDVIEEVLFHE